MTICLYFPYVSLIIQHVFRWQLQKTYQVLLRYKSVVMRSYLTNNKHLKTWKLLSNRFYYSPSCVLQCRGKRMVQYISKPEDGSSNAWTSITSITMQGVEGKNVLADAYNHLLYNIKKHHHLLLTNSSK